MTLPFPLAMTRAVKALAATALVVLASIAPAHAGKLSDLRDSVTSEARLVPARAAAAVMPAAGGIVEVVEFYNAALQHYFVSADAAEIAVLDGGAFGGAWKRTGNAFPAWDVNGAPAGTVAACRFFGTDQYRADGSRIGPNSHFYTADPAECAFVKTAYQSVAANGVSYPAWTYEANAFAAILPVGGTCAAGSQALYRSYNDGARGDPNHRYSLNVAQLQGMPGWTFEGLVMCVPAGQSVVLPDRLAGCGDGCPAASELGNGTGLVNVIVTVTNPGAAVLELVIPRGSVFSSEGDTLQNGIALETLQATIAPGTTRTFLLSLFCINAHLAPSSDGSTYSPVGLTSNPALLELAALVDGKLGGADAFDLKGTVVQSAVWEITDGPGSLTAAQKNLLAAILALDPMDPVLLDLVLQFFDSTSGGMP